MTIAAILLAFGLFTGQAALAQTFTVLHAFSETGSTGQGLLTIDRAGNLYGATTSLVYQLKRSGSGWLFLPLHQFSGGDDGYGPGPLTFGPDGVLYGMTGGGSFGSGTVYRLTPSPSFCHTALCPWLKTILYSFSGGSDGSGPVGPPGFGPDGSLFGITNSGGANGKGVMFKLTKSGNSWTESVLHDFAPQDGDSPQFGPTVDTAGNVYGTFYAGGVSGWGTVYELSPSGGGWIFNVIHSFAPPDGTFPAGGVIVDPSGTVFGATTSGPGYFPDGDGSVFTLVPGGAGWTENIICSFAGQYGGGPYASLSLDAHGNLYGTTFKDGPLGFGNVFRLNPSGGGCAYAPLHDFDYYNDGAYPMSTVLFDSEGNLFGTTSFAGPGGHGTVWEITP